MRHRLHTTVDTCGRATMALAGGSTPRRLYERLAELSVPWSTIDLFWGDERHVPPDHPESNFGMVREALLSRVDIPAANVHRIRAEQADATVAALDYEAELRQFFASHHDALPRFDVLLLGMGPDGHTASLFPGTDALREKRRWVVASRIDALDTERITLTLPVIDASAAVLVLVAGEEKAATLARVLEADAGDDAQELPVRAVRPTCGDLIWMADRAAAGALLRLTDGDPLPDSSGDSTL